MESIWPGVPLALHDDTSCYCAWHVYAVGHGACHSCLWATIWWTLSRQELFTLVSASLPCKHILSHLTSKGGRRLAHTWGVVRAQRVSVVVRSNYNRHQSFHPHRSRSYRAEIWVYRPGSQWRPINFAPDKNILVRLDASWVARKLLISDAAGRLDDCSSLMSVHPFKRYTPFHHVLAQEIIIFMYKNTGFLLNFTASFFLIAQVMIAVGVYRMYTNTLLTGHTYNRLLRLCPALTKKLANTSIRSFCVRACICVFLSVWLSVCEQAVLWSQTRDLFADDWPDLFNDSWPDDEMPERLKRALNLWRDEYWIMALITLLLWCRMLNCLLPFRCLYCMARTFTARFSFSRFLVILHTTMNSCWGVLSTRRWEISYADDQALIFCLLACASVFVY